MVADSEVLREPQSLQEGFSASQREHPSSPANPVSENAEAVPQTSPPENTADEQQLHGTVGTFVKAITEFFEEAEKNLSAHPTAHVIGGIVVGILIGRMVGRRS